MHDVEIAAAQICLSVQASLGAADHERLASRQWGDAQGLVAVVDPVPDEGLILLNEEICGRHAPDVSGRFASDALRHGEVNAAVRRSIDDLRADVLVGRRGRALELCHETGLELRGHEALRAEAARLIVLDPAGHVCLPAQSHRRCCNASGTSRLGQ
jgi:hypothetical protein